MPKYDLSVLIPARNEEWLSRTVENILANKRGKTEVIIALDGAWANPGIPPHPDVTLIYFPESIGQRAATNQACRLSKAKYVMKLDAHCLLDEGFDVKMMMDCKDDWTMIPTLYNLHAFDWVCPKDGERQYQGPSEKYKECPSCGGERVREIVFKPRFHKRSYTYRFDKDLHFQYWSDLEKRQQHDGDLIESMSAQGSCFMLTRQKYWELDICDEAHGSWGQQGTEVACKTWLSGGRLVVTKKTWYSHLFRTQGGDFGFPYSLAGSDVDKARRYSKELWIGNTWPLAKHDLNWLLEKFKPVPEWHDTEGLVNDKPTKGIIYYTDNKLNVKIARAVQKQLKTIGLPIVSCSLKPMENFGKNIYLQLQRGYLTMFTQILTALENSTADIIYMCEHDVLYHKSHFDFIPPDKDTIYYDHNWIKTDGKRTAHWDADQVAMICAYREILLDFYRQRIATFDEKTFDRKFEPLSGHGSKSWKSEFSNIDIRHGANLTKSKWSLDDFRDKKTAVNFETGTIENIPGWDTVALQQLFSL